MESNDAGGRNEKYVPWIFRRERNHFYLGEEKKKYFTGDMGNNINNINNNYHLKLFSHIFNPL